MWLSLQHATGLQQSESFRLIYAQFDVEVIVETSSMKERLLFMFPPPFGPVTVQDHPRAAVLKLLDPPLLGVRIVCDFQSHHGWKYVLFEKFV